MKAPFLVALSLAAACVAHAADTAYSALRAVGKRDGIESLNRVIELQGKSGSPNPQTWKVLLDEPRARGGVREIEVQRGKIVSERTPTSRSSGRPMNFNQLNIDSDGVFTIINQEAQKMSVPFDRVDFLLRSGTNGGAPIWEVELFDGRAGHVGTMSIAADSGTVLNRNLNRSSRGGGDDHDYLDQRAPRRPSDGGDDRDRDRDDDHDRSSGKNGLPGFLDRVGRHFEKRGRQLENFFTGK